MDEERSFFREDVLDKFHLLESLIESKKSLFLKVYYRNDALLLAWRGQLIAVYTGEQAWDLFWKKKHYSNIPHFKFVGSVLEPLLDVEIF